MKKLILSMMVSVDGFIEGPNKELDWHMWDEEMEHHMFDVLNNKVDTILLGRKAYQLLADYWPTAVDSIAPAMNNLPKIVFSKSLEKTEWSNTRIVRENIEDEIFKLKQPPGKDLILFGGANIASTFINGKLIDEYWLFVNPIVLCKGTPLFQNIDQRNPLKLTETKNFRCGNMLLKYQPGEKVA